MSQDYWFAVIQEREIKTRPIKRDIPPKIGPMDCFLYLKVLRVFTVLSEIFVIDKQEISKQISTAVIST